MNLSTNAKNTWASNLIRVSAALSLADYYLLARTPDLAQPVIAMCIVLSALLVLAMFIRAGHAWPKWVLLVLLIVTIVPDVIGLPAAMHENIAAGLMAILIDLIQVTALVLLFIRAKDDAEEEENLLEIADQNN